MIQKKNGYTIIELLVVITIIIILSALGFIAYGYANSIGRDSKRKSDIENLRSALEFYRADNGYYPDGSTSFATIATKLQAALVTGGYMSSLPVDPKDNTLYPYQIIMTDGRPVAAPVHYYGYCLATKLETGSSSSNCVGALPTGYTYGVKNP